MQVTSIYRGGAVFMAAVVMVIVLLVGIGTFALLRRSTGTTSTAKFDQIENATIADLENVQESTAVGFEDAKLLDDIRQQIGSPMEGFMTEAVQTSGREVESPPEAQPSFRELIAHEASRDSQPSVAPVANFPRPTSGETDVTDPQRRHTSALRDAARRLDAGASELEDVEAYDLADRLREHAAQLRLEARQSGGEQVSSD